MQNGVSLQLLHLIRFKCNTNFLCQKKKGGLRPSKHTQQTTESSV